MGGFSIWHWLIVLVLLGGAALMIGLVIWLARRASRPAQVQTVMPSVSAQAASVESRLRELDMLKEKGLITDAEYTSRRADILRAI